MLVKQKIWKFDLNFIILVELFQQKKIVHGYYFIKKHLTVELMLSDVKDRLRLGKVEKLLKD